MRELTPGLIGVVESLVAEEDTARRWGSGLVPVFSTPALVALMEGAAVNALDACLDSGSTSVGARIDVQHLAATPIGMHVRARAELQQVDGRRLVFQVGAWDEVEQIGQATHERVVVSSERFVRRVEAKGKKTAQG
jgi:fluoroacetyl-CoA thioesterase